MEPRPREVHRLLPIRMLARPLVREALRLMLSRHPVLQQTRSLAGSTLAAVTPKQLAQGTSSRTITLAATLGT